MSEFEKVKESKSKKTVSEKLMKCPVVKYDKKYKTLDADFCGCVLRFYDVEKCDSELVNIKYRGTLGKCDFEYSLVM